MASSTKPEAYGILHCHTAEEDRATATVTCKPTENFAKFEYVILLRQMSGLQTEITDLGKGTKHKTLQDTIALF